MSTGDFDRLRAAMKAARAQMTGRTLEQVDEDIHRERLANLEPPEPTETYDEYLVRMIYVHGTSYSDAALENYRRFAGPEGLAIEIAKRELRRFMLPKRRGRKGAT